MKLDADFAAYLASETQIGVRRSVPLSKLTSMQVGGAADYVLSPRDTGAFLRLLDRLPEAGLPYRILGNGTNIIAPDGGYAGIVVLTGRLDRISRSDRTLRLGAGVLLPRAANAAREAGLSGLEELYGIPGTVGGALVMNAGAYGREISDTLSSVTVYDPSSREVSVCRRSELSFSYRFGSIAARRLIVLSAVFELAPADPVAVADRMHAVSIMRSERQPMGFPSAGCIFRRTDGGESAGKLIRSVGLAGKRVGGAEISEKHAGFIINRGGATAADIRELAEEARLAVLQKLGIDLAYEVEFL